MSFVLALENGMEYPIPATITLNQRHIGGAPRARFIRAYGSDTWWTVQDGIREPQTIDLEGILHTDRNESLIRDLLNDLEVAAKNAIALVHTAHDGTHVEYLPLLGALPITAEPDGIDGTYLMITQPLIPLGEWVSGSPGEYLLLDSGSVMLLDNGAKAMQQ